jgi:hypothetical protein
MHGQHNFFQMALGVKFNIPEKSFFANTVMQHMSTSPPIWKSFYVLSRLNFFFIKIIKIKLKFKMYSKSTKKYYF